MDLLTAIDDANLDVYETRILIRVARRGICFEAQRSMAESMKMSLGKLNATIKILAESGWIIKKSDPKTQKMGWAISEKLPDSVSPHEQTQQNLCSSHDTSVLPHEQTQRDLYHHMNTVLPHERHLKEDLISLKNKREREEGEGFRFLETESSRIDAMDIELWAAELNTIVADGYYPISGAGRHQKKAAEFRQTAKWIISTFPDLTVDDFKAKWQSYWSARGFKNKPWLSQILNQAEEAINFRANRSVTGLSGGVDGSELWQQVCAAATTGRFENVPDNIKPILKGNRIWSLAKGDSYQQNQAKGLFMNRLEVANVV